MIDTFNQVILVDEYDEEIGLKDKQLAHIDGDLHRAFSIFIFNSKNELLLQKRAQEKYHSPGLWTNTCCSHPQANKSMQEALKERLTFEMGLECELIFQYKFLYKAAFDNGLTEHELDHVYFGKTDQTPKPNSAEVAEYKYVSIKNLRKDIYQNAEDYTAWMKIIMDEKLFENIENSFIKRPK